MNKNIANYRRRKIRRLKQQLAKAKSEKEVLRVVWAILQNLFLAWAAERGIRMDDDIWRTMNGSHILVGEGGEIKAGAGGKFNGKTFLHGLGRKTKIQTARQQISKRPTPAKGPKQMEHSKNMEAEKAAMLKKSPKEQKEYLKNSSMYFPESLNGLSEKELAMKVANHFDLLKQNGIISKASVDTNPHEALSPSESIKEIAHAAHMNSANAKKAFNAICRFTTDDYHGNPEVTAELDKFIKRAPAYSGTIYRGLACEDEQSYNKIMAGIKVGGDYKEAFKKNNSFSSSQKVADEFSGAGNPYNYTVNLVCVGPKTAVPIAPHSAYPGEKEVLTHSQAKYTVMDVKVKVTSKGACQATVILVEKGNMKE